MYTPFEVKFKYQYTVVSTTLWKLQNECSANLVICIYTRHTFAVNTMSCVNIGVTVTVFAFDNFISQNEVFNRTGTVFGCKFYIKKISSRSKFTSDVVQVQEKVLGFVVRHL